MALHIRIMVWLTLFIAIVINLFVDFSRWTVRLDNVIVGLVAFSGTLTMLFASMLSQEISADHRWADRAGAGTLAVGLGLAGWNLGPRISILAASACAWGILILTCWCAGLLIRWIRFRYLIDRTWEWDRIRVLVVFSLVGAFAVLAKNLLQAVPDGISRAPGQWIGDAFTYMPPLYVLGMIFPACLLSFLPCSLKARTIVFVGSLFTAFLVGMLGIPTHEGIPVGPLQTYFLAHSTGALVAYGVYLLLSHLGNVDQITWQTSYPLLNRMVKASCYLAMIVTLLVSICLTNFNLPHLLKSGDLHQARLVSGFANDLCVNMGHGRERSYLVLMTQYEKSSHRIPVTEIVGQFLVTAKDTIDLRIEGTDQVGTIPGLASKSKCFVALKETTVSVEEFRQCASNGRFLNLDDVKVYGDLDEMPEEPKIKAEACRVFAPVNRQQLLFVLRQLDSPTLRVLNVDNLAVEMVSLKSLKAMFPSSRIYVGKQHSHDLGIPYDPLFAY